MGITIPLIVIIASAVGIYVGYRRKMCCFRQFHETNIAQMSGNENVYVVPPAARPEVTRNGFIDDTNFAEIDLNDSGGSRSNAQQSPMASYIEILTAR